MMDIDLQVLHVEDNNLKVTYTMREICGPYDEAKYEKYEEYYATGFTIEELIASCAVEGGIEFYKKYGKKSELTYIKIERED